MANCGAYLTYQSWSVHQVLPVSLTPYLFLGMAYMPPTLNTPAQGLDCPSPSSSSLCNPFRLPMLVLFIFYFLVILASWSPGSLIPPPLLHTWPSSGLSPLWTLTNVSASGYALLHIYNKLSPPPYPGAVMSSF